MSSTREQFIETTCELLETQGYHATGLNQIVAESGAPKGSLYYHFPQGKEELTAEAIARSAEITAERIRANIAGTEPAAVAIPRFVERIADNVEASGYRSGGPLMTVALETATSSERLNIASREGYTRLQAAFAEKLVDGGYDEKLARELATFVTSAIEGGIILSRTYHSGDPLRLVARQLRPFLEMMKAESTD
ncbi:MAG: TetR/AcrR family transcriptional regulator [Candidatus Promineifilaceae bacterium]|nr:TetR/AcrR family transcriptional regulator [Candidatus Promineifilaceae bacterium]